MSFRFSLLSVQQAVSRTLPSLKPPGDSLLWKPWSPYGSSRIWPHRPSTPTWGPPILQQGCSLASGHSGLPSRCAPPLYPDTCCILGWECSSPMTPFRSHLSKRFSFWNLTILLSTIKILLLYVVFSSTAHSTHSSHSSSYHQSPWLECKLSQWEFFWSAFFCVYSWCPEKSMAPSRGQWILPNSGQIKK